MSELAARDEENIVLGDLIDMSGNIKGIEEFKDKEGNYDLEALSSLLYALQALSQESEEDAKEKKEAAETLETEIADIQAEIDEAKTTVADLQKDVTAGESMQELLSEGASYEEMMARITSEPYTVTVDADDQATNDIDSVRKLLNDLDGKTANTSIHVTVTKSYGDDDVNGSHASGLGRVPFDGYIARLHEGEAVLTKSEASLWRAGKTDAQSGWNVVGDAGASFQQVNNFNVPVQTPDEFAKTMRLYATYGLEGVI